MLKVIKTGHKEFIWIEAEFCPLMSGLYAVSDNESPIKTLTKNEVKDD